MTTSVDFPTEFLSLEADFVDNKMAINNSISDILRGGGKCLINLILVYKRKQSLSLSLCLFVVNAVSNASQFAQAQVVEAQRRVSGSSSLTIAAIVNENLTKYSDKTHDD